MANRENLIIEENGSVPGAAAAPDPAAGLGANAAVQPTQNPATDAPAATPTPQPADSAAGNDSPANDGNAANGGMLSLNPVNFTAADNTQDVVTTTGTPEALPAGADDAGKAEGSFNVWLIVIIAVIALLLAGIALIVAKLVGNSKKKKRSERLREVETMPTPPVAQKPSTRVPVHRKGRPAPAYESAGAPDEPLYSRAHTNAGGTVRITPASVITGAAPGEFKIGFAQTIGARENQEDSYCITDWTNPGVVAERGLLAAVADGIGGLSNGQVASGAVVRNLCGRFERQDPMRSMSDRLLELAAQAQQDVLQVNMRGDRCGTTLVSVLVKNEEMAFLSVGDSRIALYRAGVLLQLNREHILGRDNEEKHALGLDSETLDKRKQGALTSYLGKENLRAIDRSLKPIRLVPGDRVLLMSDGVFGTLKDQEIIEKLSLEPEQAAKAIIRAVEDQKRPGQDNATIVIVGIG